MGCVTYFLTTRSNTSHASTLEGLRYRFQSRSVSACFKYQCSYHNILQASLLRSCLHDKVKHVLKQVQACSLYMHFTTIARVIILLAHNLKTLTGPNTYFAVDMVADLNINEVTKKHAVPLYIKGLKRGLVPAAGAVRLQIWERLVAANRHKGLHYTDFSGEILPWTMRLSVRRSTRSQSSLRSNNELLYSHYSFMLHVILHCLLFISLCFLQLHCTICQCGSCICILIYCVFDSSIARKCMRTVDEKQEMF